MEGLERKLTLPSRNYAVADIEGWEKKDRHTILSKQLNTIQDSKKEKNVWAALERQHLRGYAYHMKGGKSKLDATYR